MACCAVRGAGGPAGSEILIRAAFRTALWTGERGLAPLSAWSARARLWRDFATMLRDAESREAACQPQQARGVSRLRRVLAGKALRRHPRSAGWMYRRMEGANPGVLVDLLAAGLAGAME